MSKIKRIPIKTASAKIKDYGDSSLLGWFWNYYGDDISLPVVTQRLHIDVDVAAKGCIDKDLKILRERGFIGESCIVEVSTHSTR